eukprot:TRINITY_DN15505_c0_g1_i1.p1 TRINITY_DN15505_c0_g1~~TRINITY_DN15505_c0_g1_i1.p1  ORF type:complete len:493 (+),score=46.42 TRINITY_DN15505_c0_g1_i1:31-1509(+)
MSSDISGTQAPASHPSPDIFSLPRDIWGTILDLLDPKSIVSLSWSCTQANEIVPILITRANAREFELAEDVLPYLRWINERCRFDGSKLNEITLNSGVEQCLEGLAGLLSYSASFAASCRTLNFISLHNASKSLISLDNYDSLTSLYIWKAPRPLIKSLEKLTNLVDLHIFGDSAYPAPETWLKHLSMLTSVTLVIQVPVPFTLDKFAAPVLPGIEACVLSLRKLEIICEEEVFVTRVLDEISACSNLTSFSLECFGCPPPDEEDALSPLNNLTSLTSLSLKYIDLGPEHLQQLTALDKLTFLNIDGSTPGQRGMMLIASHMTNLETLELGDALSCDDSDLDFAIFRLPKLKSIRICEEGDASAKMRQYHSGLAGSRVSIDLVEDTIYRSQMSHPGKSVVTWPILSDAKAEVIREKRRARKLALTKAKLRLHQCAACGQWENVQGEFPRCGSCKSVRYCNQTCQRAGWLSGHRLDCKTLAQSLATAASNDAS